MLVSELVDQITLNTDNVESLDFAEQKQYINAAIDYLSLFLAGKKDPELMTVVDIAPGLPVPSNFIGFVPANGYPVYILGNVFNTYTGLTAKQVKYTTAKPHISELTDTVPFRDMYSPLLVMVASMMINNRTPGISVAQEAEIKAQFETVLTAAKGG